MTDDHDDFDNDHFDDDDDDDYIVTVVFHATIVLAHSLITAVDTFTVIECILTN